MWKLLTLCVHTQHSWRWQHWELLMNWCSFLQRCFDQPWYKEDKSTSPSLTWHAKQSTPSDCSWSTLYERASAMCSSPAGGRYIWDSIISSPVMWSNVNRPLTTFLSLTHFYNVCTTVGHIAAVHVHASTDKWQNTPMYNNNYLIITCNMSSLFIRQPDVSRMP